MKEKSKNIIKTITIDIAGTEVQVTPEQAKNLYEALEALLGVKETVKWYPYQPYYPTWRWEPNIAWSAGTRTLSGSCSYYSAQDNSVTMRIS